MKHQTDYSRKIKAINLVSLMLLSLLLVLFMIIYRFDHTINKQIKQEGSPIEVKPIVQKSNVMTEIPGYADMVIQKADREIWLINPEHNQVLFKYTIVCNDDNVYQTEYIAPGNMVKANLYDLLDQGSYSIILKLETRDIQSDQTCNSANIHLNLTVEK